MTVTTTPCPRKSQVPGVGLVDSASWTGFALVKKTMAVDLAMCCSDFIRIYVDHPKRHAEIGTNSKGYTEECVNVLVATFQGPCKVSCTIKKQANTSLPILCC